MIAKRIKALRIERHLNQEELSKRVNVQKSTISGYETGRITPSKQVLDLLADFFNVYVDYLVGKTDIRSRNYHDDPGSDKVIVLPDNFDPEITNKLVELIEIIDNKRKID